MCSCDLHIWFGTQLLEGLKTHHTLSYFGQLAQLEQLKLQFRSTRTLSLTSFISYSNILCV